MTFWLGYWWPSIKGNAPEDATSLVIVGIVTAVFVPRIRRWWIAREQHLHAKLDHVLKQNAHIIHHTEAIPNEHDDGTDLSVVPDRMVGRIPPKEAQCSPSS